MSSSLLFIPDISGFTNFVQTTEISHSQHVIAELLEVLLAANRFDLQLAEVEGDALFLYKENQILDQKDLLAQIEAMYIAFYSHLKLLEKNRICSCNACSTAIDLELKIVVHVGYFQFIEIQNNRKPFGEAVIQVHRLLKNSIKSDNYVLISNDMVKAINMDVVGKNSLFEFKNGEDTYDNKTLEYLYAEIKVDELKLIPFDSGKTINIGVDPDLVFEKNYATSSIKLMEIITNYKYRYLWETSADEIIYNENEITRLDSSHVCVVNGKQLDFDVVTKLDNKGELIYGEVTSSLSIMDKYHQFFSVESISENESKLKVEQYFQPKNIFQKLIIHFFVKKEFEKKMNNSLNKLREVVIEHNNLL